MTRSSVTTSAAGIAPARSTKSPWTNSTREPWPRRSASSRAAASAPSTRPRGWPVRRVRRATRGGSPRHLHQCRGGRHHEYPCRRGRHGGHRRVAGSSYPGRGGEIAAASSSPPTDRTGARFPRTVRTPFMRSSPLWRGGRVRLSSESLAKDIECRAKIRPPLCDCLVSVLGHHSG